jgi:SAM-dependent methyltransferase
MSDSFSALKYDCNTFGERNNYRNRVDFIESAIRSNNFNSILDIGAGGMSGNIPKKFRPMAAHISRIAGPERYTALELDPFKANRLKDVFGVSNIHIGNLETFSPDKTFDIVFAGLVLQSVSQIDIAIKNLKRLLSQNGLLIFDCPNVYWWGNLVYYIRKGISRLDQNPTHLFDATITTWAKRLVHNGFILNEIGYVGGMKDPIWIPPKFREFIGIKAAIT